MRVSKFLEILGRVAMRVPISQEARVTFEISAPDEPMRVFDAGSVSAGSNKSISRWCHGPRSASRVIAPAGRLPPACRS
jgi:hypothetical protein